MTRVDLSQQVLLILQQRYRLLAVSVVIGLVAGASLAQMMSRIYRAEITVISNSIGDPQTTGLLGSGQLSGLAALAGLSLGHSDEKGEALEYLQSRSLARKFIQAHDLLPTIYAGRWDARQGVWRKHLWRSEPTLNDAVAEFRSSIFFVREDKRTGVLRISMESSDRQAVAKWANAYLNLANSELRARAIYEARLSLVYLNRELQGTTVVELRSGLFRLIEEQTKRIMLAKTREDYAFKVIDPAEEPDQDDPVRPHRSAIMIAVALSTALATVLILLALGRRKSLERI